MPQVLSQVLSTPAGGYRPRSPTNDLKEIVNDHMDELFLVYDERFRAQFGPLHPRLRELFERFIRCGDWHFGFAKVRCKNPDCPSPEERLVPLSCRTRGLCPSCGQRRAIEWAERMVEDVLPRVPYRQLTFTIPRILRRPFLFDRSLYGDFSRTAYRATRDYLRERAGRFPGQKEAVPAMVCVPQSFGDLLVVHPHLHSIVSLGVFGRDGLYHPLDDVDFSGLEELFRERFFKLMLRREKVRPETVERMRSWPHSGFHVDFSRKLEADDRSGLEGLLSYMERPPVALRRLTYLPDRSQVHYQGTRVHPRLGIDHQLLRPLEFLAMLVPHVLLRYEVAIRTYGAVSTTFRRRLGWVENPPVEKPPAVCIPFRAVLPAQGQEPVVPELLGEDSRPEDDDSNFARKRRRGWAKLIAKVWHEDPQICKSCGERMEIISVISSPGQDDVIERILRHLHLWDPPWKRPPRARAPPPPSSPRPSQAPARTIDPIIDDELYLIDPLPADDFSA